MQGERKKVYLKHMKNDGYNKKTRNLSQTLSKYASRLGLLCFTITPDTVTSYSCCQHMGKIREMLSQRKHKSKQGRKFNIELEAEFLKQYF